MEALMVFGGLGGLGDGLDGGLDGGLEGGPDGNLDGGYLVLFIVALIM